MSIGTTGASQQPTYWLLLAHLHQRHQNEQSDAELQKVSDVSERTCRPAWQRHSIASAATGNARGDGLVGRIIELIRVAVDVGVLLAQAARCGG